MGKIRILDEAIANRIAAGEVVERPASVVKELVENAIDAGATRIVIDIEEGGIKLIRVRDNGTGIEREDIQRAFARHATSKIKEADDLFAIHTLGFRGEALPSIAAVSKLTVWTKTAAEAIGTKAVLLSGQVTDLQDAGTPQGTTMEVRELFYNTPARFKFLKSAAVEGSQINETVQQLALCHPEISFSLSHQGREIFKTPGNGKLIDVLIAVLGFDSARQCIEVKWEEGGYRLKGFVGKPGLSRGNRGQQWFAVNGRTIKSRLLSAALEDAYHTLMMVNRFPVAVLQIETDPAWIDVNVHPAKIEVRFSDEAGVRQAVYNAVRDALKRGQLVPREELPSPKIPHPVPQQVSLSLPATDKPSYSSQPGRETAMPNNYAVKAGGEASAPNIASEPVKSIPDVVWEKSIEIPPVTSPATPHQTNLLPPMYPVGQVHNTYIVAQSPEQMFIIDQHAAHERILYEKLMAGEERKEVQTQRLLVPLMVEFLPPKGEILQAALPLLSSFGFEIENFGPDAFMVRGVPMVLAAPIDSLFFFDIVDRLTEGEKLKKPHEAKEMLLISMACKGAIKANHRLDLPQMEALLADLRQTQNPYSCPHGRPTIISFSRYELEKKFKRVV